jgi:hypothetical protein
MGLGPLLLDIARKGEILPSEADMGVAVLGKERLAVVLDSGV